MICFHNIDEPNGYLSNWLNCELIENGKKFASVEQYMMWNKAIRFHDQKRADLILETTDPARIKQLGREVEGYNEIIWNGIRPIIVYRGLMLKFTQNEELKKLLLDTKDEILAECAVHDHIWGIGLSMSDPNRFDLHKWKGENRLGFALMEVREALKKQ